MTLIRRPAAVALAAGLMVITVGAAGLLLTGGSTPPMRPPPLGLYGVPAPLGPFVGLLPSAQGPPPAARPVTLTIPLIGVRTDLVTLGLTASGAMQVPSSTKVAGWFTGSPLPGAVGSAIIAGHIDSLTGPGVFYRLSELQAGDRVYVGQVDGSTVEFQVTAVRSYLKEHFPTQGVFGPIPYPQLRLITCGGDFDFATGHYLSNTVVYASEVAWSS
jgi:hypothetical protein